MGEYKIAQYGHHQTTQLRDERRRFILTWYVSQNFGGMTSMCLFRARLFAELGNIECPVLTFDLNPKYQSVIEGLRSNGQLPKQIQLFNIYEHYRGFSSHITDAPAAATPEIWDDHFHRGVRSSAHYDANGTVYYIENVLDQEPVSYVRDFYRPDGTLFAKIQVVSNGTTLISLFNKHGQVVEQYADEQEWYRSWLVRLAENESTTLIVDDGRCTQFVAGLVEEKIVKVAVFHTNHIVQGGHPVTGELVPHSKQLLEHPHEWDSLVFLTDQQRNDVIHRFGETSNLFTISNPRPRLAQTPANPELSRNRGTMICRLVPVKNIRAAIDIIDTARQSLPDLVLDIYGEGPRRAALEELISKRGLNEHILLHGHVVNASHKFQDASFSLLTSRHEGQSLAIMESQAQGCPPVAFDVRYGPADLIENGRNGYLTAFDDVELAANRVVELCNDADLRARIAAEAWKSSERFSPPKVFELWQNMLATVWNRRHARTHMADGLVTDVHTMQGEDTACVSGWASWRTRVLPHNDSAPRALAFVTHSGGLGPHWIEADVSEIEANGLHFCFELPGSVVAQQREEQSWDISLFIIWNNSRIQMSVPNQPDTVWPGEAGSR